MNQLYSQMQQGNNFLQQFMRFRNGFSGNAQQQVQQLLNSGKVSQAQYDRAVQIAQTQYGQAMRMMQCMPFGRF